jgi:phosphate transport system permease protein
VRTRKIFKPTLELLAGVPSVVYGLFAVVFVGPSCSRSGSASRSQTFSVLSAGLVLGVMIIPTVASLAEDAMSAVPRALREASYGLGANRMRTVLRVVFPAATSGIAAAIVLGLSRAVGETMIVAMAAGSQAKMVTNPLEGGQTMTGFIASAALGDSVQGSLDYYTLFAVGLLSSSSRSSSTSSASASSTATGRSTDGRHDHRAAPSATRPLTAESQGEKNPQSLFFLVCSG